MNIVFALVLLFVCGRADTINHDQVQPLVQPTPVTTSETTSVKFKPQLHIGYGCASFREMNAAGEITGGLKGTEGTDGCTEAPLGSQMYGRSAWYRHKWAMVFAWYFPKGFFAGGARKRHDWASMVIWLDNPALETPKMLGASLSQQLLEPRRLFGFKMAEEKEPYNTVTNVPPVGFVGAQPIPTNKIGRRRWDYIYVGGSNVSIRVSHAIEDKADWLSLTFSYRDEDYHDLIMWNPLTEEAREALNSADFGESKVPFNDEEFNATLALAWPF